jgi:hypothetical protein
MNIDKTATFLVEQLKDWQVIKEGDYFSPKIDGEDSAALTTAKDSIGHEVGQYPNRIYWRIFGSFGSLQKQNN